MRKDAEERKNEILDVAEKLFIQKGYDGTSTNNILENVGIARGTLYYHFKSKEDIMDALIERYSTRLLGAAKENAADKRIPIMERIIRVVMSMQLGGESSQQMIDYIHKPQNALMHQKIQKVLINGLTPILSKLIQEGIEQGLFHTPYPYECMEMVVTYANIIFDDEMGEMTNETRLTKIQAFVFNCERLLGAESGSLVNVMKMFGQ